MTDEKPGNGKRSEIETEIIRVRNRLDRIELRIAALSGKVDGLVDLITVRMSVIPDPLGRTI